MPDPPSLIDEWVEDLPALLRYDHRWQNLAEGLTGGREMTLEIARDLLRIK